MTHPEGLTVIDANFPPCAPLPVPDAKDAHIPDNIPNIRECDYLGQPFMFESGGYRSKDDGHVFTDDEFHRYAIDVWDRQFGRKVWVPVPLTHMAYKQALREVAEAFNETAQTIEIDRELCRVTIDGRVYAVRLSWLHSPGREGAEWGSNNWIPERGKRSAESMREFYRLNEGKL